jgi:phosphoglycerate dehydrogenase-like enzyme
MAAPRPSGPRTPLERLPRESDIVSLHLRLSAETTAYLNRDRSG